MRAFGLAPRALMLFGLGSHTPAAERVGCLASHACSWQVLHEGHAVYSLHVGHHPASPHWMVFWNRIHWLYKQASHGAAGRASTGVAGVEDRNAGSAQLCHGRHGL